MHITMCVRARERARACVCGGAESVLIQDKPVPWCYLQARYIL
jgi:hypothetical protein